MPGIYSLTAMPVAPLTVALLADLDYYGNIINSLICVKQLPKVAKKRQS